MDQIKGEVSICIFTWNNYPSVNDYTGDDKKVYDAFVPVVLDLRKKHGPNVPVYLSFCPLTIPNNQIIYANQGFSETPAVQIFSNFTDGSTGAYYLQKDPKDKLIGIDWQQSELQPYVEALLYQSPPTKQSILCTWVPQLCRLSAIMWLAGAGVATYKAIETDKPVFKTAWAAGAFLMWESFFKKGGFKQLKLK
jgi:hypothetical protein